jgi:hypothetical protein
MSSLKSGALLSLFSGFSFEGVQRASHKRDTMSYDKYPAPSEIAHAARFSGPSQVFVSKAAAANSNPAFKTSDAA